MDELDFLKGLVSIDSPSGCEASVARYLSEGMVGLGFRARGDEAGNVVGQLGDAGSQRHIVLLGHMDTVPGRIPVREAGGRLYGRGTVDAKGPLAAFVWAAARVGRQPLPVRLTVIGAVDEEGQSIGAHHLAETMAPPECVIIGEPGGWQGITLGYKGALQVTYRWVEAARHAASGHAAPAERAVAFWERLVSFSVSTNRGRTRRFEKLDAHLLAIHTFGDGLEQGVEMNLGLRLPVGLDVTELEERMPSWADGAELTFSASEPPFVASKNTALVRALLRAIRGEGGRPRFKLKTGTSDMNVVGPAWGCPIVAYGPGDSALDHTPEEHIEVAEFLRAIDVLQQVLETVIA